MGRYVKAQRLTCIIMMISIILVAILKYYLIKEGSTDLTTHCEKYFELYRTLGINFKEVACTSGFYAKQSFYFEIYAGIFTLLLIHYYNGQVLRQVKGKPFHYVHHSEYLSSYMVPYYTFFFTITVDTFFTETIIQIFVLGLMYLILFFWAIGSLKKNYLTQFVVVWVKRIIAFQLVMISLFQIYPIFTWASGQTNLFRGMFVVGFIFDADAPGYISYTHLFLMCFTVSFGQLYDATHSNYLYYKENQKLYLKPNLTQHLLPKSKKELLMQKTTKPNQQASEPQEQSSEQKKLANLQTLHNKLSNFDYQKFIQTYIVYLSLWIVRICTLIFAYFYFGYPSSLLLTWLLLSFIVPLVGFVKWTTYIYLPLFTTAFFYLYFINIERLFLLENEARSGWEWLFEYFGMIFTFPPIEIAGMVTNLTFLLILKKQQKDLQLQRNEFREAIFKKLSDKNSNFLWQLFFYVLKRIHIPVLILIFVYGLNSFNIFYIGILYFFVVYTSSLPTYRKSGSTLIFYAAFFIWLQYIWELFDQFFDSTGNITKVMTMITLQDYTTTTTTTTSTNSTEDDTSVTSSINQYMEYSIPWSQWLILMLFVLISTINRFFEKYNKPKDKKSFGSNKTVTYYSLAEYYEARCDYILTLKFPATARFLIRISMIFSEMIILVILIIQGFMLVWQNPNYLYWLFLILSLNLQTSVVSVDEETQKNCRKCVIQARILKLYSGFVMITQIIYSFMTDPDFLAQYGLDGIINRLIDDYSDYMAMIGLVTYDENTNIAIAFLSPVLFYITASFLEDYFKARVQYYNEEARKQEEEENKTLHKQETLTQPLLDNNKSVYKNTPKDAFTNAFKPGDKYEDDDVEDMTPAQFISFEYDKIRFSIPYMIYQRLGQWRIFDAIALNFHLVTATVTIYLCCNWQISLFMAFYLFCTVILCIRAARSLHQNGKNMQLHHVRTWNKNQNKDVNSRNQIESDYIKKEAMNIDEAHQMNKVYMLNANQTLLGVRKRQWNFQYWLLVLSMIIMYPTPLLIIYQALNQTNFQYLEFVSNLIYWLFLSGVYFDNDNTGAFVSQSPIYIMLILLILEKIAQRWQNNRYGCTLEKIREFKELEEKLRLVSQNKEPNQLNLTSEIKEVKPANERFITIMEAKQECNRIESLFREQTIDVKEKRLKETIELGIKRKYTIQFRTALKFIMEQISLQLLLLSCANKSNIVSILYLGLLLAFLLIKNKTTGMLIMSYAFGAILAIEYCLTLTNLTAVNTPMQFPRPFQYYPCGTTTDNNSTTMEIMLDSSITTYPDCSNLPGYQFVFPWYLSISLFTNNFDWARFFSIDVVAFQVNDIWFDFFNLALLTIYFFNYGNPINANNLKVSFSQTKRLEDALIDYSKIQVQKKYYMKKGEENPTSSLIGDDKNDQSFDSEKAADDSHEYFLGSTYYLQELKSNVFIYYFTKKMRYFVFIGVQLVTILMIFLLAFLCRSLMSLGYMIACIPLIYHMTDFFNLDKLHQDGKQWKHPYIICGPLMWFSFADIALQIFCQIPSFSMAYSQRLLGFDKIFYINTEVTSFGDLVGSKETGPKFLFYIDNEHLYFLVLKSLNLFFIFLQSRIYQSEAFWKFIRVDLRRIMSIGNHYKKWSMTYRYNNWKLQKIITLQQRKKKMYEGVAELKMRIAVWQNAQRALVRGEYQPRLPTQVSNLTEPLLDKVEEEKQEMQVRSPLRHTESFDATSQINTAPQNNVLMEKLTQRVSTLKISQRKLQISKSLGQKFKMSLLQDLLDKDDDYFEKKETLEEMKKKLGKFARLYMWLHKNHINQIAFISDIEEGSRTKKMMSKGYRTLRNDLEKVMIQDINLIYEARKNKKEKQGALKSRLEKIQSAVEKKDNSIKFTEMRKTQEFLEKTNLFHAVVGAIFQAIFCKCATLCYLFMFLSQCLNAGMISILYPFAIFGYALMEEGRPGKTFWQYITYYTLFILFMKFIAQLTVWNDLGFADNYKAISDYALFGLWQTDSISSLFSYIIPEILVLAMIMGQTYYEIMLGLYDTREIELENISQAKDRFLDSFNESSQMSGGTLTIRKVNNKQVFTENEDLNEDGLNYEQRVQLYPYEFSSLKKSLSRKPRDYEDHLQMKTSGTLENQTFVTDIAKTVVLLERKISFIDDTIIRHSVAKNIKLKRNPKKQTIISRFFKKNPYFQRLFPAIKEQKPGIDLYARITFIQFIICCYLISNYTYMDARGAQNLENSAQYSVYMVIMLFVQVFVMILERYISRTNTRITKRKGPKQANLDDEKFLNNVSLSNVKSMTMNFQPQKTGDTMLMGLDGRRALAATHEDYLKISLEETRMTQQQVAKWIIQWILLVVYHILIFWFFPIVSNYAIYGTPYCMTESSIYKEYGCYNFSENSYVIVFYFMFCYYFMLSALQIRHGYPDWRTPSCLTETISKPRFYWLLLVYNMPFLMELKIVLDWAWTKTSLDVFQWLELGQVDVSMYQNRNRQKVPFYKPLGEKIGLFKKCFCSCFCLNVMLFFLVGPFLFFSNLSSFSEENLIYDASLDFTIKINDQYTNSSYEYPLFFTDSPLSIQSMTYDEFLNRSYNTLPETKFFDVGQVQKISFTNVSDTEWSISSTWQEQFLTLMAQAQNDSNYEVEMTLTYKFDRPLPDEATTAYGVSTKILDVTDDADTFTDFLQIATVNCTGQSDDYRVDRIRVYNFVPYQLRLGEAEEVEDLQLTKENLTFSYYCSNYWAMNVDGEGLLFITFSDYISSGFFSTSSLMAFYVSVAYVVGTMLRKFAMYNTDRIFIQDIPNSDVIRNLIQCIFLQRLEQNLVKEEEYFFILFELLRSPELLKAICGSSLKAKLPESKKQGAELFN